MSWGITYDYAGCHLGLGDLICDTVQEAFAAKVKFPFNQRWRGAEGVFKMVERQDGVLSIMPYDHGSPISGCNVDASGSANRRRKDEILDAFQP